MGLGHLLLAFFQHRAHRVHAVVAEHAVAKQNFLMPFFIGVGIKKVAYALFFDVALNRAIGLPIKLLAHAQTHAVVGQQLQHAHFV